MSARRGGGRAIVLLLAIVLVLGGLVAADRIVHARVEREVGQILQDRLSLTAAPAVVIHGFPFLTQVVANRYGHVDVAGSGIRAGTAERPLLVDRINLSLRDVVTSDGYRTVTAGEVTGTGQVTWAEVSSQIGVPVAPDEGGRVRLDLSVALYGQQADVVLTARPVLDADGQQVRMAEPRILIARYQVPDSLVERIAAEQVPPVPIVLPLSLRASSLTVSPDHLELGLAGSDVSLAAQ